jgi:hypothetical protein
VYSNTSGLAPVLNEVKAGVDKLIGWFIPASYSVVITPANISGVSVAGNTIKLSNVTASGEIATVRVSGSDYDGNIRLVIVPDVPADIGAAVKTRKNATVTIVPAASGEITVNIYPAGEFDVVLRITLSGSGVSGTIVVNTARY